MLRTCVRRLATRAGIANDDLARKAMLEPTTAARVGAEQYFRDAEREALEKRREGHDAQGEATEKKEQLKAAAIAAGTWEDPDAPPRRRCAFDISDDAIRGGLMAIAAFGGGRGPLLLAVVATSRRRTSSAEIANRIPRRVVVTS